MRSLFIKGKNSGLLTKLQKREEKCNPQKEVAIIIRRTAKPARNVLLFFALLSKKTIPNPTLERMARKQHFVSFP